MSRISDELLQRWNDDLHSPLISAESTFDPWWSDLISRSLKNSSEDDWYAICVGLLDSAMESTMQATQSEVRYAYTGLSETMQALEAFQNIDTRSIPSRPDTFDVEDLQQTLLLIAFQFDSIIGSEGWINGLQDTFRSSTETIKELIRVSRMTLEEIKDYAEYSDANYGYDELAHLDNLHWVIGMLEWLKLEDPRRSIQVDLIAWKAQAASLEQDLRPGLKKLQEGGVAFKDKFAPDRFWWRR